METATESPACAIAREALGAYLQGIDVRLPDIAPDGLGGRAGAYVTWSSGGVLRGSMGTISPVQTTAAREIAFNAFQAGVNDPRFEPVSLDELDMLSVTVDVLEAGRPLRNEDSADDVGVLVTLSGRTGIALPGAAGPGAVMDDLVRLAIGGLTGKVDAGAPSGRDTPPSVLALPVRRFGSPLPREPGE